METYGMAAPDNSDNSIDCYHQYVAQTGYKPEHPGDYRDAAGYSNGNYGGWFPGESNKNYDYEMYGASTNRSYRTSRRGNTRNGLLSQETPRAGGDYNCYNSLPGLGNYQRPAGRHERRYWF